MRRHELFPLLFAAITAMALTTAPTRPAAAQPAVFDRDYPMGFLERDSVMRSAAEVTTEEYPNADDVLVDDYILVRYEADGRAVTWDDTWMKVLTEKGRRENRDITVFFHEGYTSASLTLIEVIKPDGTVIPVDIASQSQVMIDPSQMASNIYDPSHKLLTVGIPGLEVGDVVRSVSRNEIVRPRMADTWGDLQVFEYTSPIKHYVYEVYGPKERPLESIALKDPVEGTVTETRGEVEGRLHYRWEVADVPRMYPEPNMPPLYTVVQRLLVSTIPDWETVSSWYWDISKPHFDSTPAMEAQVGEITRGIQNRRGRIEAIFRWVSQNVRYMGITVETESPGYEPHDVSMTFENRHGVCRDKAALLVVMLRIAGFDAYPVLIHSGPKKDPEAPLPWFNHAISCVQMPDGSYLLMDSTDETTKELFPAYLCDMSYLVAKPGGEKLLTSPITPPEENMMRVTTQGRVDAEGKFIGSSFLRFEGINDNMYRGFFSRQMPEERRRYFEGLVKRILPGASLNGIEIRPVDMRDASEPLTAKLDFQAPDVIIGREGACLLSVPRLGTRVGIVNFILDATGLDERKYPLQTDYACGVNETVELSLDPSLGNIDVLPEYEPVAQDTLSWRQSVASRPTADAPTLDSATTFTINVVEFSPEQYLGLKGALRELEFNSRKKVVVEAPEMSDQDVVTLSSSVDITVNDARNWSYVTTMKQKVLTYKGIKENSELTFGFNPVWEDVTLKRAVVRNGDETQEISEQEINIMDASWVGSAPRYSPARTLVASLPGVTVGSIIEYEVERTFRDHPFFNMSVTFRRPHPLLEKLVSLSVPEDLEIAVQTDAGAWLGTDARELAERVEFSRSSESDRDVYRWQALDMPPAEPEDDQPPWLVFNPGVLMSTGDYEDYAHEVREVLRRAAKGQTECRRVAREVIDGLDNLKDEMARARAVRDFVEINIRPAGPGLAELPLTEVSTADRTLEDGYGNTTDRAVVFYAMLREAGFRPRFVLASSLPRPEELARPYLEYPGAEWFSTVLVRIDVEGIGPVYLNDTSQYALLGTTSHEDNYGLELASGEMVRIEPAEERETWSDVDWKIAVDTDGTARLTQTRRLRGTAFEGENRHFTEMTPEERDRHHQEIVSEVSQLASPDGDLKSDFSEYPGVVEFSVVVDRFAVVEDGYLHFTVPFSLGGLFGLRADERITPLYRGDDLRLNANVSISLPASHSDLLLAPESLRWLEPDLGTDIAIERLVEPASGGNGPSMELDYKVHLSPCVVPAAMYPRMLEMDRTLNHPEAGTIMLKETAPAGESNPPVDSQAQKVALSRQP